MSALKSFFHSGLCATAHAVGYDKNTRSHFEEQDTWETGVSRNTIYNYVPELKGGRLALAEATSTPELPQPTRSED
jgi:uncharacterized protein (DUF1501 family)